MRYLSLILALLLFAPQSFAWTLNTDLSTVNFLIIKSEELTEVQYFTGLEGEIDDDGNIRLDIDPATVTPAAPLVPAPVLSMMLHFAGFPNIHIEASVPDAEVPNGYNKIIETRAQVSMHDETRWMPIYVQATRFNDQLVVSNRTPLILDTADFGLDGGLGSLRGIVGLSSLSRTMPVNFVLIFDK